MAAVPSWEFKHATGCTCRPGASYIDEMCGLCARKRRAEIFRGMTPEQQAYDRYVDSNGAYHTDFLDGCSCHISPPCSFCTSLTEEEVEALNTGGMKELNLLRRQFREAEENRPDRDRPKPR